MAKGSRARASNTSRSKKARSKAARPLQSKTARKGAQAQPALSARLNAQVTLQAQAGGALAACFNDYAIELGRFSTSAIAQAAGLRDGLPLASFASASALSREVYQLVQRLAKCGLLEFPYGDGTTDLVVIEPQTSEFWPQQAKLGGADRIVLSRFAYMRRRGDEMVLESARADALFRIPNPSIAAALSFLSVPRRVKELKQIVGFPGIDLLGLLLTCGILFKVDPAREDGRRGEGDDNLVLWDFHDLLFHTRSTEGRHANPLGGVFPHVGDIAPLPAVRPSWDGDRIDLNQFQPSQTVSPFTELLRARHSVREFDDAHPITLAELARLLDQAARIRNVFESDHEFGANGPVLTYAARAYPSAGSAYELELYLAIANCEGLRGGFYHYDASAHALVRLAVEQHHLDALLSAAAFAMDAPASPQVLVTVAARFGRVSWKYSSLAYSLILKDVGVLLQTLYLTATDMGLGGCAIGTGNIEMFAQMTGLAFHVEGPVGQFALGRGAAGDADHSWAPPVSST